MLIDLVEDSSCPMREHESWDCRVREGEKQQHLKMPLILLCKTLLATKRVGTRYAMRQLQRCCIIVQWLS